MARDGLVVDASVISKWYLRDEDLLNEADAILRDWRDVRWSLVAPGHLTFEVGHAILRAVRRGRLTAREAERALDDLDILTTRITFRAPHFVVHQGFHLALALGSKFYDACYLQVARIERVSLLTADEAFYRQAGTQPDVLWLGDYVSLSR